MERLLQIRKLLLRSQRMSWVVLGFTLVILAGAILVTTEQTRTRIRAQITGRDREILHAVARMQMPQPGEAEDWVGSIEDPANQLTVVLETSRLSGVMGASLFSPKGELVQGFPADLIEGDLSSSDLATLRSLKPVSRFYPSLPMSEIFLPDHQGRGIDPNRELPVLEVSVPLHTGNDPRLLGIARFVIEGYSIAQEFAQLDRNLWRQGLSAFLAGAVILILAVSWSFRRLNRAHRLLAE